MSRNNTSKRQSPKYLKSSLECFNEQDEPLSVLNNKARMVELENNFFPVQCRLQFVNSFYKDLSRRQTKVKNTCSRHLFV